MKSFIFLLIALILSAIPAQAFPVVEWSVASGGNGHFYELIETPKPWHDARLDALAKSHAGQSGDLATVTSAEENEFIALNLLASVSFNDAWIGGFQPAGSPEPGGNWQWVTGEPWDFQNWDVFEPNNIGGIEDALWMFTNYNPSGYFGLWNDAPSSFERPYIVEYAPEPVTGLLCFLALTFPCRTLSRRTSRFFTSESINEMESDPVE